jgi:chromosome segregation protein
MRLKQLKLAGFKSFVEPTTIPFSSQLIGVVGPNGCGKSNLIDAVRWVLGESLARQLRGESMLDVIFNGSSQRKPIGQAFVELIFDNHLGRLGGPYASYQEIAIKRQLSREGESQFYLNGHRCRRRDITDLFLGTGASARGYSIIGQEMISRLVEARPDELRAYLEEAAGVSKYKERRRETLLRLEHTQENLARVADLRSELEKQLLRLERQAKNAQRYTALRQAERETQGEIFSFKWRTLKKEEQGIAAEERQWQLEGNQRNEELAVLMQEALVLKTHLDSAHQTLNEQQAAFYQQQTEIVRLEETVQQEQRDKQRLQLDQQQLDTLLQQSQTQIVDDEKKFEESTHDLTILSVQLAELQLKIAEHQKNLQEVEGQKAHWLEQQQALQAALHPQQRKLAVEELRLHHVAEKLEQRRLRFEVIYQEEAKVTDALVMDERASLTTEKEALSAQQKSIEQQQLQQREKALSLGEEIKQLQQAFYRVTDSERSLMTEQAGLKAAQQLALSYSSASSTSAFAQWDHCSRLAEVISVDEAWLACVEFVLSEGLQALVVDSIESVCSQLETLQGQGLQFVTLEEKNLSRLDELARLSDKISGLQPAGFAVLDQIFAVECLADALAYLPRLNAQQSIVSRDGYWLSKRWLKIAGVRRADEPGLLWRAQRIAAVDADLTAVRAQVSALKTQIDDLQVVALANEAAEQALKREGQATQESLNRCQARLHQQEQAAHYVALRMSALNDEKLDLQEAQEEGLAEHEQLLVQVQATKSQAEQYEAQLIALQAMQTQWDGPLKQALLQQDELRDALQAAKLQEQGLQLNRQKIKESLQREGAQQWVLQQRLKVSQQNLLALQAVEGDKTHLLQSKRSLQQQLEQALSRQRDILRAAECACQDNEKALFALRESISLLQEKHRQTELNAQKVAIHLANLQESLAAMDMELSGLLSQHSFCSDDEGALQSNADLIEQEEKLKHLHAKIEALGAINLIAIEEYQTELARKNHLDEQYQDLMDALSTLNLAIDKLDKETSYCLKETFDQVNASFQVLFPRLFGGGHAGLAWTCDNLLEAGILITAQPPGKRNSRIHLLSGGEKAMTAVAFVFAIFQLNPSPFCLLDEVDAPLDDANVQRFCELLKEMSHYVQFLFITHNKVSMELAEHLIGVTMREPGVSRIVAVDVEQALAIAE